MPVFRFRRPGCAGSWQTGRMGERGGSQSGSPAARQQSANEKRAVARNTAQRHLCQRHQQEMRLQHHVIVRRLSRQGTELRHVVSELTKQQSMIRHDDGSGMKRPLSFVCHTSLSTGQALRCNQIQVLFFCCSHIIIFTPILCVSKIVIIHCLIVMERPVPYPASVRLCVCVCGEGGGG